MFFKRKKQENKIPPKAVEDNLSCQSGECFTFHAFMSLPPYVYLTLKRRSQLEKKSMTTIVRDIIVKELSGD